MNVTAEIDLSHLHNKGNVVKINVYMQFAEKAKTYSLCFCTQYETSDTLK
jgi:hypothetical protein